MSLKQLKPGDTFELAGETVTLISKGSWECVVERADGTRRYPRVKTVERALGQREAPKPKRARKAAEPTPEKHKGESQVETPELVVA